MFTYRREKGLAIVEFTILLPIFLFLLFTILELGRAFYTYTELEKSARSSARYLTSEASGTSGTYTLSETNIDSAKKIAMYGSVYGSGTPLISNLTSSHIDISLTGDDVKVEINYPYQPFLSVIPGFLTGNDVDMNFTLTSSYSMRVL